jgi:putative Holliday junction resolvase
MNLANIFVIPDSYFLFFVMNILAIDYGTKNIGLALVDTNLGVVLPFGVVQNQESRIKNQEVISLIKKEKIDKIIVGLPMGLDGKENKNTERIRKFVEELKLEVDIPIEFFDERFSSQQADAMGGGVSRDEKAAMVVLQSYLGSHST